MATVTGLTAARMLAIEASCIVDGGVVLDNLILTKQGGGTIDAGSVRGPIGTPGVSQAQLDTFMNDHLPIGSSVDYVGVVSPSVKWLAAIGQTIIDGLNLYPDFWAVIPIGMKSGSDIIMPNTIGKVSVGYDSTDTDFDTIGEVGGAKTHVLTQAELPAVGVAVNPPSTLVSIDPPNTVISIDPPNTASGDQIGTHIHGVGGINVNYSGQHNHGFSAIPGGLTPQGVLIASSSPSTYAIGNGGEIILYAGDVDQMDYNGNHFHVLTGTTDGESGVHHHNTDITPFNANVDIGPFNANVDIAQFNSSNLGSGVPHSIIQPYVVFLKLIKVL